MRTSPEKQLQLNSVREGTSKPNTSKEIGELNEDILGTITNLEFLRTQHESRLSYITFPRQESSQLKGGSELTFRFTFNGKFNRDLYMGTTAGQVLPPTVEEVTLGGTKFSRDGLYGEFFSEQGVRLIIRDNTRIQVSKYREKSIIDTTENEIVKSTTVSQENDDLIIEARKRNIDPEFAVIAFSEKLKTSSQNDRHIMIEHLLTNFARTKGAYGVSSTIKNDRGIYHSGLALSLLSGNNTDWKEKARKYGITDTDIQAYETDGMTNMSLDGNFIDNGENLAGEKLWNHELFQKKVREVCARLSINPEDLRKVMIKESGIDPKAKNPSSHATGLIQFMPKTAKGLGTTVGHLRGMSGVEQMNYVERYFEPYKGKLGSVEDLYLATFYPAAIGKSDDFVIGSEGKSVSPEFIASQNSVIAQGKSVITVGDFKRYVTA